MWNEFYAQNEDSIQQRILEGLEQRGIPLDVFSKHEVVWSIAARMMAPFNHMMRGSDLKGQHWIVFTAVLDGVLDQMAERRDTDRALWARQEEEGREAR